MRNAFAKELLEQAVADPRVVMLSGDIGNRLFDDFKAQCGQRFFNCGVAEANMMSVAAGLALCGLRPVVYTITPFVTTRCLEQIRVDVCYHQAPVVIVGVGAGLSYASLGATHQACEDIAFLRVLPNMRVVCPADPLETRLALRAALAQDEPIYIRLGKKGEPPVHAAPPNFVLGQAIPMRSGTDLAIVSTGTILSTVLRAADLLAGAGLSVAVSHLPTVKPLDASYLLDIARRFRLVVTVEEHSVLGGFGGAIAELYADAAAMPERLLRLGTADRFLHEVGGEAYSRRAYGLDAESLARSIRDCWKRDILKG